MIAIMIFEKGDQHVQTFRFDTGINRAGSWSLMGQVGCRWPARSGAGRI